MKLLYGWFNCPGDVKWSKNELFANVSQYVWVILSDLPMYLARYARDSFKVLIKVPRNIYIIYLFFFGFGLVYLMNLLCNLYKSTLTRMVCTTNPVMLSECFKAMGACRSCHRTPSVRHLAGADAWSNINGLVGSDEDPSPFQRYSHENQQFAPEKMMVGGCYLLLKWILSRGHLSFGGWNYIAKSCQGQTRQMYRNSM